MLDCSQLSKIELHCHLGGTIDAAMAREIRRADPDYPIDPLILEQPLEIVDVPSFFQWWDRIRPISGELSYFFPIYTFVASPVSREEIVAQVRMKPFELPGGETVSR